MFDIRRQRQRESTLYLPRLHPFARYRRRQATMKRKYRFDIKAIEFITDIVRPHLAVDGSLVKNQPLDETMQVDI